MELNVKKFLKGSLINLAILGMIGGSLNNVVNAKHRRYHYRFARHYRVRRHAHRRGRSYRHQRRSRRRFHAKRLTARQQLRKMHISNGEYKAIKEIEGTSNLNTISHLSKHDLHYFAKNWRKIVKNPNTFTFDADDSNYKDNTNHESTMNLQQNMANDTLNNINADRENNGLSPYAVSPLLTNIAAQRAYQLASNYSHYNSNGVPEDRILRHKYGYHAGWIGNDDYYGENIACAGLGHDYHTGHSDSYNNHNGSDMAYECENEMVNHDGPRWGHRANILSNHYRRMGVGTYSPDGQNFYLAEDFSS